MNLFKKIPFSFKDNNYEIRIYYDDSLITLMTFRDNHPANGFRHQIKLSKRQSPDEFLNNAVIEELANIARDDIAEERWERLSANPA